jgi:hypothetical protein
LKVAASHYHHKVVFILIGLLASKVKPVDLGIPPLEKMAHESLGLPDKNVVATVPPPLTTSCFLIGRRDQEPSYFLHEYIEPDKGEKDAA